MKQKNRRLRAHKAKIKPPIKPISPKEALALGLTTPQAIARVLGGEELPNPLPPISMNRH